MWDVLNKIAIIGTIIGIPIALYAMFEIIYKSIVIYDMYREQNETSGYTINIGAFSRMDYRRGKKENPQRQYHLKGRSADDEKSWK